MPINSNAGVSPSSYSRVILVTCFLTLMIVYGAQYSFGVFFKPVLTELGCTRSAIAGAYSLNLILTAVCNIFAGKLCDRFGPRLVVTVSGLFLSCGYLLMSQVTAIWEIYLIYGVILGVGIAGIYIPLMSTVVRWFLIRRGLASGIVSAGIGVGLVMGPPLASFLISNFQWRISYMVMGLISLAIPAIFAQLLKREQSRGRQVISAPQEAQDERPNLIMQGLSLQQAIRIPQFWMISAMFLIFNFSLQTVMVHLVAYATDTGISLNIAATIISTIGITSIISKVGMGSALDRIRSKPLLTIVCIVLLMSFLLLLWNSSLPALYFFAIIFAVGYGGFATAQSPAIAEYFGLREHGTIFGVALSIATLGSACGPYIAGYIYDTTSSYNLDFMICSILLAIGIIISVLLKPSRHEKVNK